MKFTATATLLALGAAVTAQDIASLPPCGQVCIGNMLTIATTEFGCKPGDVVCYCTNVNFGYGVRDCSNQSCSREDAAKVIQFGTAYCQAALTGVTTVASGAASGLTVLSSAAVTASGTGNGGASASASASGSGAGGAASTPVTTTPLVTTIVSDGSTILSTTGFQTIFAPVASDVSSITGSAASAASSIASSAASAASSVASGAESSAESVASSAAASASEVASSAASHASSAVASATGGASSSSSSAGAGPMKTAAPILGVAAMGALLLI